MSAHTTIFDLSRPGRRAATLPAHDVPDLEPSEPIPAELLRSSPAELPEVAEIDLVRHYTRLSTLNYGVESGPYPLGSCTMKYNPKVNERLSALEGFRGLHPYQPDDQVQGALLLMKRLEVRYQGKRVKITFQVDELGTVAIGKAIVTSLMSVDWSMGGDKKEKGAAKGPPKEKPKEKPKQ